MTAAFESAPDGASYLVNGPVLNFARRVLGWSKAEFGRRVGVHESTVGRMLAGAPTTAAVARRIHEQIPGLAIEEIVWLPGISKAPPPGALNPDALPPVPAAEHPSRVDLVHGSDFPPPA